MPPEESTDAEMKAMLARNAELLEENNHLLRKLYRNAVFSFWMKVVWFAVIIGLPFALYFYILEPYFAAFGSSYDNFLDGLNELPGFRGINELLNNGE